LADDARTAIPPPAADARTTTPPPTTDAGAQGSVGDVGASTSAPVIGVDLINAVSRVSDHDLVADWIQIEQASKDRSRNIWRVGTGFVVNNADTETLGD
jgi:hypothetical protein